jgi:hypothetical protein
VEEEPVERLSETVTVRTMLAALIVVFVLATAAGAAVSALVIQRGSAGPTGADGTPGPRGLRGPPGPRGEVDDEAVLNAIEGDPDRVAQAVQSSLDPDPADVSGEVDQLRSDFDGLCSSLHLAPALEDVVISC